MKKILLLIVSGLLIACMAGSAMAQPAIMTLYDSNNNMITKIAGGNPTTVRAHVSDIWYDVLGNTHARTFSVSVVTGSLQIQVSDDGGITWTDPASGAVIHYTANIKNANAGNYDFLIKVSGSTGKLTIKDTSDDAVSTVEDPVTNTIIKNYDVAAQSPNVDIPEFPTVALPVAAILGLVFIFGRKKEEL